MEPIVQALIVAIIVIASAVFAAWRLMSARTRLRVLDAMKPTDGNALGRWLLHLSQGVLAELTSGGCASCSQAANHVQKPRRSDGRA
jgi:heme A synthase